MYYLLPSWYSKVLTLSSVSKLGSHSHTVSFLLVLSIKYSNSGLELSFTGRQITYIPIQTQCAANVFLFVWGITCRMFLSLWFCFQVLCCTSELFWLHLRKSLSFPKWKLLSAGKSHHIFCQSIEAFWELFCPQTCGPNATQYSDHRSLK